MTPASRTPEGFPSRCVVCGAENEIDYSLFGGDAPCPNCGHLLIRSAQLAERLRTRITAQLGLSETKQVDAIRLDDLGADSLDLVEIIMELEEEFDVSLSDSEAKSIQTIGDLLRVVVARTKH